MEKLVHRPLGQRIPDCLHAVSCSLPTMADVIGYEERDPAVLKRMTSGYPRFVKHPLLREVAAVVREARGLRGQGFWPTASRRAAQACVDWLALDGVQAEVGEERGIFGVVSRDETVAGVENFRRVKTYLQHTGGALSSREAEDFLVRCGRLPKVEAEAARAGDASEHVRGVVAKITGAAERDVLLANGGMNAFWATFQAIKTIQTKQGRRLWVQLGWLYLDTIEILKKFTAGPGVEYVCVSDVFDLERVRKLFAERGHEIAGVVTEVPTNPLIQTADVGLLRELCRRHDAVLVLDPTVQSAACVDLLPHADVLVTSLTKYAASAGDVMMGAVVLNASGKWAGELRERIAAELEPVYARDVARLAAQIDAWPHVAAQVSRTASKVVEFLQKHPAVKQVFWSTQPGSRENYLKVARASGDGAQIGSMISFVVSGPVARVYDRMRLAKGPSFGITTTLISPFIFLAHYDLVTSEAGRAELARNGIEPELLRLSVGCEPAEEIIAALAEALA